MGRRVVADVMTAKVISVPERAPFKQLAKLLATHRVSAVPVLSPTGKVVGVVSEADLLLKLERPHAAGDAAVAADLMNSPAITAGPHEHLGEAARRMHACRVKRLPVVDSAGRLVGIVSRADLIKVFVRPDEEIRRDVARELIGGARAVDPARVRVQVRAGLVSLQGRVELATQIPLLVHLAEGVDGVVGVDHRLDFEVDDRPDRTLASYPYLY